MRKFTFFHLEIRELDKLDIALLSIFLVICIGRLILTIFTMSGKYWFSYEMFFVGLLLLTVVSPMAIRFSSIKFSAGWLILSLTYIIESQKGISYFSLCLFMCYHIIRWIFWSRHHRELIPPNMGKGWYSAYYSKLEKRESTDDDYKYMKAFIWMAAIVFGTCLLFSGHGVS